MQNLFLPERTAAEKVVVFGTEDYRHRARNSFIGHRARRPKYTDLQLDVASQVAVPPALSMSIDVAVRDARIGQAKP